MNEISLKLSKRTATGKKVTKLRKSGIIPSVIYGGQEEPIMAESAAVETIKVARAAGRHTPVHLTIDGKKQLAIIKAIDLDPAEHHGRREPVRRQAVADRGTAPDRQRLVSLR